MRHKQIDAIVDRVFELAARTDNLNDLYVAAQLIGHFEQLKGYYTDEQRHQQTLERPVPTGRTRKGGRAGKAKAKDAGRLEGEPEGSGKAVRYRCICPPGSTCTCGSVEAVTFRDRVRPRREVGTPDWFREALAREWPE